jgi:hypothetical protein
MIKIITRDICFNVKCVSNDSNITQGYYCSCFRPYLIIFKLCIVVMNGIDGCNWSIRKK